MEKTNQVKHVAIIMDGNRRWAAEKGLEVAQGHREGVETLATITKYCARVGINYLTVYALSTENLVLRNKKEILGLFSLIQEGLQSKLPQLHREGIRIQFFGDLGALPSGLRRAVDQAYQQLQDNKRIQLNIALNYGGRAEMVSVVKQMVSAKIDPKKINEEMFSSHLFSSSLPDPEILIRTGGQKRLSNFLLWQAAYSELFFTDTLWPDFSAQELDSILTEFSARQRNFGR